MKPWFRRRTTYSFGAIILALLLTFGICFFALSKTAVQAQKLTVVIDAGHGGIDLGVTGKRTGVAESDLNLAISRLLQTEFESAGFAVVQTRLTEAGLYGSTASGYKKRDMQKRAEIIKTASPALVISLHQNQFSSSARRGAQVFYLKTSEQSHTLACKVQNALNDMEECVREFSPLAGDYFILKCSEYPSVIVECGFLSNAEDEKLLVDEGYQTKLAKRIAQGAISYLSSSANG